MSMSDIDRLEIPDLKIPLSNKNTNINSGNVREFLPRRLTIEGNSKLHSVQGQISKLMGVGPQKIFAQNFGDSTVSLATCDFSSLPQFHFSAVQISIVFLDVVGA